MTANRNRADGQGKRARRKRTGASAIIGAGANVRLHRDPIEVALRANEERLRLALDAARLATWDWDIASGDVVWNDQHYRVLGYESGAFQPTYKSWTDRVHPDDLPAAEAQIRSTMERGGEYVNHFRTLWPDGTVRYLEALGRFERDAAGKAVRCYGAILDVTERRRAEEEMVRLASFPILNPHPVVEIDTEGRIFFVNPSAEHLFPDLYQRGIDHPWLADCASLFPGAGVEFGQGRSRELQIADCWYYQTFLIVPNTQHMRIYGIDITSLKRAEAALRASEALATQRSEEIETLMNLAPVAIWIAHDPQCRLITGNSYADSILAAPRGSNISRSALPGESEVSYRTFRDGVELQPEQLPAQLAASTGRKVDGQEVELVFPDGRVIHLAMEAIPLFDAKGQVRGSIATGVDISSLKTAQAQLKSLNEVLENRVAERTAELEHRSDQLRKLTLELTLAEQRERQRLAMILHDGLQQTLVAAKFRLAIAERDRNVAPAAVDATNLIDDAIETSRTLTAELSPTVLQQRDLITALEWLARWMMDKHGLEVNLTARDKVDVLTEEVMILLFQATRELLFNVVKHAGVKVASVQLGQVEGHIQVTVRDAGAGFDPRQLRTEGGQSGGTGLFIIRERISNLGGRLEIESCPGQGSQFKLVIPHAIGQVLAIPSRAGGRAQVSVAILPQPQDGAAGEQRRIRVLLVDDHMVMRQGLAALLRVEPDMEIAGEASDGEAAVSMTLALRPDVVLMDIGMPGMDGIQATRIIHNKIPDIPIIGLSMFVESEKAAAIKDAGAVNYLEKSGPSEDLIAAIRACGRGVARESGTT
jgi:PAS domain S-box-containing protein